MSNIQWVAAPVIAALANCAYADFAYISQTRSITASAVSGAVTDSQSMSASDFGPFNATVNARAFNPDTGFSGFGSASQTSSFAPLQILAGGSWSGRRDGQTGQPSGGGTSTFHVSFTIDTAVDYEFTASTVDGAMFAFIFTGAGPGGGLDIRQPGTYAGTLVPGPYLLDGVTSGSAGFPAGGGGFNLRLTIPSSATACLGGLGALVASRRRRPIA